MKLKAGYRYQLQDENAWTLPFAISRHIDPAARQPPHNRLERVGRGQGPAQRWRIVLESDWALDGASGGMRDTDAALAGAGVHDGLYQQLRWGVIHIAARDACDDFCRDLWLAAGMWRIRAWYGRRALKRFGAAAADPDAQKPVREIANVEVETLP